jgi:hypothetical protein
MFSPRLVAWLVHVSHCASLPLAQQRKRAAQELSDAQACASSVQLASRQASHALPPLCGISQGWLQLSAMQLMKPATCWSVALSAHPETQLSSSQSETHSSAA